ncbi:MAG: rod shape-determining protein RodA [Verrucomicrobia bacterium]|nr:rod shape-determining protein RodA [Verrucomicrobiota bacterium]
MDWTSIYRKIRRADWMLALAVLFLLVLGVLFIYSACYRSDAVPVSSFYKKQIVWAVVGILCFFGLAVIDYNKGKELAWALYASALVLLIVVLVSGKVVYGARRWLDLFGIRVQPSEFAKIATILVLARHLSRPGRNLREARTMFVALLIAAVPFLLILKEPDLGTAAMLLPVTLVMAYVAGVPARAIGLLVVIGIFLLPVGWLGLGGYQQERILVFFDPGRDPLGAGWNKIQSEIAVGSGGLLGKGYLKGTQNVLGFLPRTVAPTDFIFSVIAEETGFLGSALILALYAAVLAAGLRTSLVARDKFGRLVVVGVMTMLFAHVFVNIAMTVGLMPITGLPLPLISYGGSFMVCTMISLGLVQSVYVQRYRR